MTLRCPTCKKPLTEGENTPSAPFCNPRCKLADLGSWLSNRYVVASDTPIDPSELSEADLATLMQQGQQVES